MPKQWKLTYVFRCPVCAKTFRTDEPGEPVCSGPSEMRDDHMHEVMRLVKLERVEVHPLYGEQRAVGRLIMPYLTEPIAQEARAVLGKEIEHRPLIILPNELERAG